MADTPKVLNEVLETLEDGRKGFAQGADKLTDSDRPEVAATFRTMSQQRADFAEELRSAAGVLRDEVDSDGTTTAALHRGWMSLKDALTGDDPDGVVSAAVTGEKHAISEYDDALEEDLPDDLRGILVRQREAVEQSRARLEALADSPS